MRFWTRAVLWLVLWLLPGAAALAAISQVPGADLGLSVQRFALVIGNGQYQHISKLANPGNDARAVAGALADVGFDVILAVDADRATMQSAIGRFYNSVTAGSEALIYYAGHGVELDGRNYLLPIDIPRLDPSQQFTLRSDGISLSLLMEELAGRAPGVSLVVLDACRNNPFPRTASRSLGGEAGLARVDPPQGTIVIYSAGAGELALDSLGASDPDPNGLFTRNFLKLIREPGLEIRPMVQELKDRVYTAALQQANHTQRPSYYDGLIGRFYFVPERPAEDRRQTLCELIVVTDARRDQLIFLDADAALTACLAAVADNPGDPKLRALLATVEEQRAAQTAFLSEDAVFARAYIALFPQGAYLTEMRAHLAALEASLPGSAPVVAEDAAPVPAPVEEQAPPATPDAVPPTEPEPDPVQIALLVQTELNRVGCDAGRPDGIWGNNSRRALENFARHASFAPPAAVPSAELLIALQGVEGRICPLSCSVTQIVQGGKCVAKTCPAGQRLSSKGQCFTPKPVEAARPTAPPRGSCFVFDGQTFCE